MSDLTASAHCPYCDLEGPHAHPGVDQAELELMRGCQRAFELELSRLVVGGHSHFTLNRHDHGFVGFYWTEDPRISRTLPAAWNTRNGIDYLNVATQREWVLWRQAWRKARASTGERAGREPRRPKGAEK